MKVSLELLIQVDKIIRDGLFFVETIPTHLERGLELDEAKAIEEFHNIVEQIASIEVVNA